MRLRKITEHTTKNCTVYRKDTVNVQMWLGKFCAGVLLNKASWLDRPIQIDCNQMKTLLDDDNNNNNVENNEYV